MMSIFEFYRMKEDVVHPKLEFRDECLRILQESEKNDAEWIEVCEKAPTREVLFNILSQRTKLKNPLWKKSLMRGLGYKSIQEMMGDESC